jgi:hypothetical protein
MSQVRLVPCPLTAKCRCWKLCPCLREPVKTQNHLATKSKETPQYWRRALALLPGRVTVLVGPAFLTRSFLSRKNMLQVRLIPYPLTAKGRCSGLCREPVRTQIHLVNKSKKSPQYWRQALALLGVGTVLVGPAFLTRSFLSWKTMLQVQLIPCPLTVKGGCQRLCLRLREPVRIQTHLANKSKNLTPQYWRQALVLLGVVTVLVGPAFLIPRGLSDHGKPCCRFDSESLAH